MFVNKESLKKEAVNKKAREKEPSQTVAPGEVAPGEVAPGEVDSVQVTRGPDDSTLQIQGKVLLMNQADQLREARAWHCCKTPPRPK